MRTVTITDENSIIQESFEVSNEDAEKIANEYSTDWMDEGELKDYLADGE
jgi:hypothetical protein